MKNDQEYDDEIIKEILLAISKKSVGNFYFKRIREEYGKNLIDCYCKYLKNQDYIKDKYAPKSNRITNQRGVQPTRKIRYELTSLGKEFLNE